jgi:drug/metabolite transporter (DMT)-like permease
MSTNESPKRSLLLTGLGTGIVAASTAAIFIRLAQHQGAASITIATARLVISALVLAPLALLKHKHELSKIRKSEWLLAVLSGIFLALHFSFWISSLEYTSITSSVVLVTTTPLWVALLSPWVLHERMGKKAMFGLFIALLGGLLISLVDTCAIHAGKFECVPFSLFFTGTALLGDILALLGAWMAAGYMLLGRKLRATMSIVPYIFIVYGMSALVLTLFSLVLGKNPLGYPPITYLWFLLLGLIPQLFGHSMLNWTLGYLPASFVSVALLGEPIGSTILAIIIFSECPSWMKLVGAGMIMAGIALSNRSNKQP